MISKRFLTFFKCLLFSCVLSGILLLIFSILWYLFPKAEILAAIGKIIMYILSCFLSGLLFSKDAKNKKYLWGMLIGLCYDLLLVLFALLFNQNIGFLFSKSSLTALILCIASGMLGGMLQK